MSLLDEITVLILTYNEEENLERTLDGVRWARRIVIIDSGSTDRTHDIARRHEQVEVIVHPFESHASQWNFGLDACGDSSDWILALDADYVLDNEFRSELANLDPPDDVSAYEAPFRYCVHGRVLRGNIYPPVAVLYRRSRARYVQSGHTQRLKAQGTVRTLRSPIYHDDRKPLSRWFASQQRYAKLEAAHLLSASELRLSDRIRRMAWPAPILVFFYTLIAKRCILDGWAGWFYVLQRTLAEIMVALELIDRRSRTRS